MSSTRRLNASPVISKPQGTRTDTQLCRTAKNTSLDENGGKKEKTVSMAFSNIQR